jgi:hypothetical protein
MNMTLIIFDYDKNRKSQQQAKLLHITGRNMYSFASADCHYWQYASGFGPERQIDN